MERNDETPILEIFSDFIWPWCYFIAGKNLHELETLAAAVYPF